MSSINARTAGTTPAALKKFSRCSNARYCKAPCESPLGMRSSTRFDKLILTKSGHTLVFMCPNFGFLAIMTSQYSLADWLRNHDRLTADKAIAFLSPISNFTNEVLW
jgi:hypothetical protein